MFLSLIFLVKSCARREWELLFSCWSGNLLLIFSRRIFSLHRYIDANEVSNLQVIGQGSFGTVFEGLYYHMCVAVKQVNLLTDRELLKFKEELALMR